MQKLFEYPPNLVAIRTCLLLLLAFSPQVLAAQSQDVLWNNTTGGIYETFTNWNTGQLPDSDDFAVFDLAGSYAVTLTSDQTIGGLEVWSGDVSLMGGHELIVDIFNITVDGELSLTGAGSQLTATLVPGNPRYFFIGSTSNSSGTVNVLDGAAITSDSVRIANAGGSSGQVNISGVGSSWTNTSLRVAPSLVGEPTNFGTVNILDGGSMDTIFGKVGGQWSVGHVLVDGAGSQWNVGELEVVGYQSGSSVEISNGGLLTTATASIGDENGMGTVKVTGANSRWENSGTLYLGKNNVGGVGNLIVEDGGVVNQSSSAAFVGVQYQSSGSATIRGADARWNVFDSPGERRWIGLC